ncbi:MAG: P-loop NTPase fold protein [Terriglobales bacterium]
MDSTPKLAVFISYSHKDRLLRDRIATSLRAIGLNVLDDTSLRSDQDWEIELMGMRERADAAILIVTPNFLASETIRAYELPRILELRKSRGLRVIPVIAEESSWQSFSSVNDFRVFPEGGRPLFKGSAAQVKADLAWLGREITGADPRETVSNVSPSDSVPTSAPTLAQLLAIRLTFNTAGSPERFAMASLIAPDLAVTASHVIAAAEHSQPIQVGFLGSPTAPNISAEVVSQDIRTDFTLLKLSALAPFPLPVPVLGETTGGTWESYFFSPSRLPIGTSVMGQMSGAVTRSGTSYQQLVPVNPSEEIHLYSGAPVVVEDRLVGILSGQYKSLWLALPIAEIANTKAGAAVRSLMGLPPLELASEESTKKSHTEPAIGPLGDRVRAILVRADQIRTGRNLKWVHTGDLLQSLAEEGSLLSRLLLETNVDVKLLVGVIPFHDSEPSTEIDKDLPRISPNVRRALVIARGQADDEKSKTIEERHLVFGVLSIAGNQRVKSLNDRGITPEKIKEFANRIAVEKKSPESEKPSQSPPPRSAVGFALAGYKSDDPTGKDLLDTQKEANALASVLAAKDVDPPLSLGLFGDWGSGKSFFMGQMQARITELQKVAREAQGQSAYCQDIVQLTFNAWNYMDSDLWASMAAEIFEGLAAAVAEKRGRDSQEERALVLAATSSEQTVLFEAEKKRDHAERELKQTEDRLQELQQSKADVEANLSSREFWNQAYEFAKEEASKDLDQAAKQLHVPEAKAAAGEIEAEILELQGISKTLIFLLRNTKKLWMWLVAAGGAIGFVVLAQWLITRYHLGNIANSVITLLAAISGLLAPFVVWAKKALQFIQRAKESKQKLIAQKKDMRTAELVAQQAELTAKVAEARKAVTAAAQTLENLNLRLEQMRADRQMADFIRQRHESSDYSQRLGTIARVRADFKHLSSLLRDVQNESQQDASARRQQDQKRIEETKRITELRREFPSLTNVELRKRLMDRRIEELEMTSPKMKELEELEKKDPGVKEKALREMVESEWKQLLFPRIDRIILYIDDLDRCPEKNVVDVLQAVHLLLAFPLFVVVVGVDPRWLLHALRQHSTAFQTKKENDAPSDETAEELLWQSTPMNYLEKIFQIPFTLRPIRKKGFEELVDAFAKPMEKKATIRQSAGTQTSTVVQKPEIEADPGMSADPAQSGLAANLPESSVPATPAAVAPGVQQAPVSPAVTPASKPLPSVAPANPEETIDQNPEHLRISDGERDFMKKLHQLIPSPRAGKRFINIYRLLRASVEEKDLVAFVGDEKNGEFRAALVLLGILTGYPEEATEILKALMEQQPSTAWHEFLNQFWMAAQAASISNPNASPRKSQKNREQVGKMKQAEAERWLELLGRLEDIDRDANLNSVPCVVFNRWAEKVARYSFQSGRVLLYQKEP